MSHVPPLVWQIINFLILAAILYKFLNKPLKAYLVNRHNAVKEKLEATSRLLAEAETLKRTYEEKLAGLDQEIAAFKNTIMAEAEQEKVKILAEAAQFTSKIKEQARMTYEQEMKEIKSRIKEDVAQLTIQNAEKLIVEKIGRADHEKLVEDFIVKLRSLN